MCRPQVAIVGSGPSGYYVAEELLKKDVAVDVLERLPTPFGLVRAGVAPDHPKIKSITALFERISSHPNFRFFGHVEVGRDVSIGELAALYDGVVLACGAANDATLGIPGEDLSGSYAAGAFVAWYNGHPDFRDHVFALDAEHAVIVGNGNVALDVARILLTPVDVLRKTEIAEHAVEALAQSRVRHVTILGRRGPAQANFTPFELKETINTPGSAAHVAAQDLLLAPECEAEMADRANDGRRQNVEALRALAAEIPRAGARHLHFAFKLTPAAVIGADRAMGLRCLRNRLEGAAGARMAVATRDTVTLPCGLLIRSIGFRGAPLAGIPFDDRRGIVPNRNGRVMQDGDAMPFVYVTGWLKRGATGIIGTNRACGVETARAVLEDLASRGEQKPSAMDLSALLALRGVEFVGFDGWRRIDAIEKNLGASKGKPREKLTRIKALLAAAREAPKVAARCG